MSLCLAVTSGKGGTGKSTVSSGLAVTFADMGKRVLLVDTDEGLPCLDAFFGIDKDILFDLSDIASAQDVDRATYSIPSYPNIRLIPAAKETNKVSGKTLEILFKLSKDVYDVIIFDTPSGTDFSLFDEIVDNVTFIIVSNSDLISVRDAFNVRSILDNTKKEPRLIINKFDFDLIKKGINKNIDDIIDTSSTRLLGIVPLSSDVTYFQTKHILKRGRVKKALLRIAKRLMGENILLPKVKKI